MSQENVDSVRRMIDAFNARDFATLEALIHPDLAWHAEDDQPETEPSWGRESYLRYIRGWVDAFDGYEVQPETFADVGDCVVMTGRVRGSGRSSGAEVDADVTGVWRFRDGIVVEHYECQSLEEAMAVAREPG
jgi:ketosteroid isomerase-like protein